MPAAWGPCQVCRDPRSTWGAWTNGKTDRREREERQGKRRPKDWEAGRRRKGETGVLRQHLGGGCPLQPTWGWPHGEGVTRTPSANELSELHPLPFPSKVGIRLELHWPENSTEGVTQGPYQWTCWDSLKRMKAC